MFDFQNDVVELSKADRAHPSLPRVQKPRLALSKRLFDVAGAIMLLLPLGVSALLLCLLNPLFNRGPLFFVQERMGFRCVPFAAFKFRTMTAPNGHARGAFDALETDRITVLGRIMRKMRIDELPQIINVLRGQMSLIGPRPDHFEHACVYLRTVPGYCARHDVLPGISGFAQTEVGYVDGLDGVHRKVAADLYYIAHATLAFDLWIAWRTLVVIATHRGS
ncbi:sugar transferase [Yoonia sp.]|uniref:sugar transferase n=1 Tax=Yoonia sp. TaxID=2212373 RepID=UPI0019DA81A9|nr:sugar transferase [Yoonia sp.]MBE0412427.1 sugar transferase [Yoonia sp.]